MSQTHDPDVDDESSTEDENPSDALGPAEATDPQERAPDAVVTGQQRGDIPQWTELTGFQRDICWTLIHQGDSKGVAITESLNETYEDWVHPSRVYQNLNKLRNKSMIQVESINGSTNKYILSPTGRAVIENQRDWQMQF